MLVNFSRIDFKERPTLILRNAAGSPITTLGYAYDIAPELHFNEMSKLEFVVPAYVDGKKTPGYDEIVGLREVELLGVGVFKLVNPIENGEGVKIEKRCKAYSLEYEFALKKISIPNGTYCFWKTFGDQSNTLLGLIMNEMPSWRVGKVSHTLLDRYRTFQVDNQNIYNLIKSTAQKSYNCIFDFDTENRVVNIIDVAEDVPSVPIYISKDNLAKNIEIEEDVEGIVTRLDVNGAEGVDIRSVNPCGTNKIITLDYYMNETNFSSDIIDRYYGWKELCEANQNAYYNLAIRYSMLVSRKVAEETQLIELKNERTNLENQLAVEMQAYAQRLTTQSSVNAFKELIQAQEVDIAEQELQISVTDAEMSAALAEMKSINEACTFENHFTAEQLKIIDRYIKDDDVTESTFVATTVDSVNNVNESDPLAKGSVITITNANIYYGSDASSMVLRNVQSGSISIDGLLNGQLIAASIDTSKTGNSILLTARIGECERNGVSYPNGMLTISGSISSQQSVVADTPDMDPDFWVEESAWSAVSDDVQVYFTLNTSDYEKKSVAWDLYEYGLEVASRLAQPSYTFSITSANFLAIDVFESFRGAMEFGRKMFIENNHGDVMRPICIGASFNYDNPDSLNLQFGDSYLATDSAFKMVDLLEQSVSMGKSVDTSKYVYSAFVDSNASAGIKELMESALDVSKNAIMSSSDQAISWDAAGLRLRKWENEAQTSYEDEQIWMNNNSIMLTDDGWDTAQMAIGKFYDEKIGECWGIIAPHIVGTLLAGSNLVIESEKTYGDKGVSVFRVDGDGAQLYNGKFTLNNGLTEILLNPDDGIAIGKAPLYYITDDGDEVLDIGDDEREGNARLWIDSEGNIHIRGTLHGVDGTFSGTLDASQLHVVNGDSETTIGEYLSVVIRSDSTVTGIQDELSGVGTMVDGKIDANNAILKVDTETKIEVAKGEITTEVNSQITTLSGDIVNLGTRINQTDDSITLLADRVTDNENSIAQIKLDNESVVIQVEKKVTESVTANFNGVIDELSGTVTGHTSQITKVQSSVSSLETTSGEIKSSVGQLSTTVETLDGKVSNVETIMKGSSTELTPEQFKITISDTIKETSILQDSLASVGVHVGADAPQPDEDGNIPHGKLWVNPYCMPEEWKYYDSSEDSWELVNSDKELKDLFDELSLDVSAFQEKVETWFTFDNKRGLVIRKPRFVAEDGTVYNGSAIYTVTNETGYHIWNEGLNEEIASFEQDMLAVKKVRMNKSIMKATSTGGFVWRCETT